MSAGADKYKVVEIRIKRVRNNQKRVAERRNNGGVSRARYRKPTMFDQESRFGKSFAGEEIREPVSSEKESRRLGCIACEQTLCVTATGSRPLRSSHLPVAAGHHPKLGRGVSFPLRRYRAGSARQRQRGSPFRCRCRWCWRLS